MEFATPPSDGFTDTFDEGSRRYRTMANIYDTTSVHELEFSALCLLGTEEPMNYAEVEKHKCWRQAMTEEMKAIEENEA